MFPKRLSQGKKVAISVVLVFHFGAVLLAGFGIGTHTHPPPFALSYAHAHVCHHLRSLGLDSSWHFYAPNPGNDGVLYVRLETRSGKRQWKQWPSSDRSRLLESYVRELGGASSAAELMPVSQAAEQYVLTERGEIWLGSFARRFAAEAAKEEGTDDPVAHVGFVLLTGTPMSPRQARDGWEFGDLRLYHPVAVGNFTAQGRRFRSLPVRPVAIADLVYDVLQSLRARRAETTGFDPLKDAELPRGIRLLAEQHPNWLELPDSELRSQLHRHFAPAELAQQALP